MSKETTDRLTIDFDVTVRAGDPDPLRTVQDAFSARLLEMRPLPPVADPTVDLMARQCAAVRALIDSGAWDPHRHTLEQLNDMIAAAR